MTENSYGALLVKYPACRTSMVCQYGIIVSHARHKTFSDTSMLVCVAVCHGTEVCMCVLQVHVDVSVSMWLTTNMVTDA